MDSQKLSGFLQNLRYEDLDANTVSLTKMCIEDLMGVAVAGSVQPQGEIWQQYFGTKSGAAEASVWVPGMTDLPCECAAALNSAWGHVIDMDDVHNSSITHLGVVTIPAALAVGQKYHCSGRSVIAAIVAGYEIGARVGEAINPGAYDYWHTTGVVGAFSSAAAAGKLLGLNETQFRNAIGSAGTQAAGLWQFICDGAMSKTLHTANATLCGIRSAELAALGFTAAKDILCGDRGFLGAMTPENHPEALTQDLEKCNYKILSNSFKPYACCRHTHAANYCAERLKARHHIDPARISSIRDFTYQIAKSNVDDAHPTTPYGFKFSVQYCIAAVFLYGNLMDGVFTEEKTKMPQVQRLMSRISCQVDPRLEALYQQDPNKWPHRLEITMEDGQVFTDEVEYPLGDFNNPFDWRMEHDKFHRLTDGILSAETRHELALRIAMLERYDDVNDLFSGLGTVALGA